MHNNGGSGHSTFPAADLPPKKKTAPQSPVASICRRPRNPREFRNASAKTQHIRIEPTGFLYPKKRKTEQNVYNVGTGAKGYKNGVYNYPVWMAENKWVTGVIYPNLLIGVGAHLV